MSDVELVKKMLRAVLQSNKNGVSLAQLQADFKDLTGDFIPYKQMGYTSLDAFLHSLSSVVKMERTARGEVICFATVCKETAHIAQLVARQRSSKKTGRPQLVNCQMRFKPATPSMLNAKPRTSLRQPDHIGRSSRGGAHIPTGGRSAGAWDHRQAGGRDSQPNGRIPAPPQNRAPGTQTRKPPAPSDRPEKRMTLPSRFQREVQAHLSRNPQQTAGPANLNENTPPSKARGPQPSGGYHPQAVQSRIREVLSKHSNGLWVSKLPQLYRELYKEELPTEALRDLEHWSHICTVEKPCSSNPSELLLYPSKDPSRPSSAASQKSRTPTPPLPACSSSSSSSPSSSSPSSPCPSPSPLPPQPLSADTKAKLEELLQKHSNGVWAHALPKLFLDTYKAKLPENALRDLTLLGDICTIDYTMPNNPKKAILYARAMEDHNHNRADPGMGRRPSAQSVPPLLIPKEEYPSVLVVEASSTSSVILRYIGEGYSQAQEALEDKMREFYGQNRASKALPSPATGQLAAVKTEEEEEFLRAQVCEVTADKAKVYYVDHGFSELISNGKLLVLHESFYNLPFQATKCRLAGLEPFSQEPAVLKKFESLACGKILLAEILERDQAPLMVLYDTSQDDDVNINAACMKALQDPSLETPLQVNSAYARVCVTNVCSDGTIYCQLPSRGQAKLNEMLEKIDAYFHSQVTSEFLVSKPFCGKCCLARCKGKWARVEITNLHGSRVLDIQFLDLGVPASVEVIELREVPPPFLRDLISIPPQAVKCCLADVPVDVGSWTADAVQRLRDAVLSSTECSMKVAKLEEAKKLAHVYLFSSKNFHDVDHSVNHQLADSDLWKHQKDVFLSNRSPAKTKVDPNSNTTSNPKPASKSNINSNTTKPAPNSNTNPNSNTVSNPNPNTNSNSRNCIRRPSLKKPLSPPPQMGETPPQSPTTSLQLPPPPVLPPPGQNMDVFVSVACHPGHFVLQPWQDLYKLAVLMGEMILYYNKMEEKPARVEKNQIYAAKVENDWHRVLVKGVLNNGLVSVYELDYGKHELVSVTQLRPLIQDFRQFPFQGITAQLAGVKPRQWSEEASIVFRNHVEKKPLVAQVESVQEGPHTWDRKVVVYLVDTSQEEKDIWVHDIMSEFTEELTKAA
ncbi:tudor domain-containing protein 7B [Conger conger]|uniref:tudor domain-containing protein 7B n=1 Tax=Conger conger TaxID=82655 RepID=UPI002A59ADEA|nr:tudor domain-containing protein 7B [Conger conger]XP_061107726.1 tudor domain-containing protein 7B [Conger conger]XP_061107727.1 tudor domain-containing protein 7B [Conger conger]